MDANTLFLRLEGPLQAWGSHEGKFAVRRILPYPTKSGVMGLLCAAMGIDRQEAGRDWLPRLNELQMGVRIDIPGIRWWDFHTVGAETSLRTSELSPPKDLTESGPSLKEKTGLSKYKYKPGPLLSRREYLCDASFAVALIGEPELIQILDQAVANPVWTPFLGRKACPPSLPLRDREPARCANLVEALKLPKVRVRGSAQDRPEHVECVIDWVPARDGETVPDKAFVIHDVAESFEPPSHHPRFAIKVALPVVELETVIFHTEAKPWYPPRATADYSNSVYRQARAERLVMDNAACVVCKSPATTTQHVDYRDAGGGETPEKLRSLCRLCHDAVTMLEYGAGMTMDRIDPCLPEWRERILAKRHEIVEFRSRATRSRKLTTQDEEQ